MSMCVLVQVRSVSVVTRAVPLTDLVVRAPKVQEVREPSGPRHPALCRARRAGRIGELHAATHVQSSMTVVSALASCILLPVACLAPVQSCRVGFLLQSTLCSSSNALLGACRCAAWRRRCAWTQSRRPACASAAPRPPTWPSAATCGALRSRARGAGGFGVVAAKLCCMQRIRTRTTPCPPALPHSLPGRRPALQAGGKASGLGQGAEVHVRPSKLSLPIVVCTRELKAC